MTISFNQVPANTRTNTQSVEIDNSRASQGPALMPWKALILGQKSAAGTAADNSLTLVTNADQVGILAGWTSVAYQQALAWFANNTQTETWFGALADTGAGVQATGSFAFTGTSTAAGTLHLYVGGNYCPVAVAAGTAAAAVATAVKNALDVLDIPTTQAVATATVNLTAVNKGIVGNQIVLAKNIAAGQFDVPGLSLTVTSMSGGTTVPVLTTIIANMGDTRFNVVAHPYASDSTTMGVIETEMVSRFSASRGIDCVAVGSAVGSVGTLNTLGLARNSPHSVIMAQAGATVYTPAYQHACAVAAQMAKSAAADPGLPFQTLKLVGILPVPTPYTDTERNSLLWSGIGTSVQAPDGSQSIERAITTYQFNGAGSTDSSYLDSMTMFILAYLRYSWKAWITSRYPRHKLASDGARFGAGQAVITPIIGKAESLAWFRAMEELGLVENFDQFKADLVVERNVSNPTRMDWLMPPDIINQFITGATKIQFRL